MINNTLIILDWDDTLFPSSWINQNNINLTNGSIRNKLILQFTDLDNILSSVLSKLLTCGMVVIVTNASVEWIALSASLLPKSDKIIKEKINVVSARSFYQTQFPTNMYKWKSLTFKDVFVNLLASQPNIENIISVGDADYEYQALINLYDWNFLKKRKRYFKSVKFINGPTYESIKDQLDVLYKNAYNICTKKQHLDLTFKV